MSRRIAIMSGKGGVGKTSISLMVAKALSNYGRTILLDFDICGPSVTTGLNVKGALIKVPNGFQPLTASKNLDVLSFGSILKAEDAVIWRGPKKLVFLDLFYKSSLNYDYVVIDMPPGISEEHNFVIDKNVEVIVVSTPQNMSLNDAQRCIDFCQTKNISILGLIENMASIKCDCCDTVYYPFGSKGGKQLADEYLFQFLGSLEIETELSSAIDTGEFNVVYENLKSYGIIKKILQQLKITN